MNIIIRKPPFSALCGEAGAVPSMESDDPKDKMACLFSVRKLKKNIELVTFLDAK